MKVKNIKLTVYYTETIKDGKAVRERVSASMKNNAGVKCAVIEPKYSGLVSREDVESMPGWSLEREINTIEKQRLYHGAQSSMVADFLADRYDPEKVYQLAFETERTSNGSAKALVASVKTFYPRAQKALGVYDAKTRLAKVKELQKQYPDCPDCPDSLEAGAWVTAYHLLQKSLAAAEI